jgi:hypothetical protein
LVKGGEGFAACVAGAGFGPEVASALGLGAGGDDPNGVGLAGVPAHAARMTPRRRDAAWRFALI